MLIMLTLNSCHQQRITGLVPLGQDSGHRGSSAVATSCSDYQTGDSDDQSCLESDTKQLLHTERC